MIFIMTHARELDTLVFGLISKKGPKINHPSQWRDVLSSQTQTPRETDWSSFKFIVKLD